MKRRWAVRMFAVATVLAGVRLHGADLESALEEAREHRRGGDLEAAVELLLGAVQDGGSPERGPGMSAVHRALGEIRLEQRRGADAARHFEEALAAGPRVAVVHYQAGLAYRMAGDERKAAERLDAAVALGFRNTGALLHLASAHFASGGLSAGLEAARQLLAMQPASATTLLQLGRALFDRFFYRDALQAFEAAVAISPDSHESRLFAALASHLLNRHEEAVSLLSDLDERELTAESAALLASALGQSNRAEEAEALFGKRVADQPDSPHAYLNLAFLLLDQGRAREAEAMLERLAGLGSGVSPKVFYAVRRNSCGPVADGLADPPPNRNQVRADSYFRLGSSLADRHHHATAIEVLRLALRYGGSTARTLQLIASSCLHLDPQSEAAVAILGHLVGQQPDHADGHHLLGRAHLRQGRRVEALEAHRAAVALEPENGDFLTELGRALAEDADEASRSAAADAFAEAARLDPRNAIARYELGRLLTNAGDVAEGLRALEEAIQLEPEFHNAYYVLGRAYLRTGQRERAEECLEAFQAKQAAAQARGGAEGFSSGN